MNYMQVILQNLMSLTFSDVIDIAVVSFLIYQLVKLVRETSSTRIIRGVIILIAAMWLSSILQLTMVNYLFKAVLTSWLLYSSPNCAAFWSASARASCLR